MNRLTYLLTGLTAAFLLWTKCSTPDAEEGKTRTAFPYAIPDEKPDRQQSGFQEFGYVMDTDG